MRTGRLVLLLAAVPLAAAAQPAGVSLPDLSGLEKPLASKLAALRQAVAADPDSDQAWGLLAMNLDVHDFKIEALEHYARAAALDPTDFRWPYYRAMCLVEAGLPGAVDDFERAAALLPGYPPLAVRQGNALLGAGELEAAQRKYSEALAAEPAVAAHAHVGLARIALIAGDAAASYDHARQAAKLAPWNAEAHGLLAELHRRRGERQQALREVELAQKLPGPTPLPDRYADRLLAEGVSSNWHFERGRGYLQARNYGNAARELGKAVEAAPTAEHHEHLGRALLGLGRYGEARRHLLTALELQPDFPPALLYLGVSFLETEEPERALEPIRRALELQGDLRDGERHLGRAYLGAGRPLEAIRAFQRALTQTPGDPRLATELAWLLATSPDDRLRDGEEALRLAEKACQATRFLQPRALDALAAASAETGRFDDAVVVARRARELALQAGRRDLARQIEARLALYAAGKPYREP